MQPSLLLRKLNALLQQLPNNSVALLRPLPADFDSRRDDVDLLLTQTARSILLQRLYSHCCRESTGPGDESFHFRVVQFRPEKIRLTLWDNKCDSQLKVDLWSGFRQFPQQRHLEISAEQLLGERQLQIAQRAIDAAPQTIARSAPAEAALSAEAALPATSGRDVLSAARFLSPEISFCLLILHLGKKRRTLTSRAASERIQWSLERLKSHVIESETDCGSLLSVAESLHDQSAISTHAMESAAAYLKTRFKPAPVSIRAVIRRSVHNACSDVWRSWMRTVPCLAIDGSDGSGKTTLCQMLAARTQATQAQATQAQATQMPVEQSGSQFQHIVAKKLYRRSWLYQLVSSAIRRTSGKTRCETDDHLAVLTTLRAAVRLWLTFAIRLLQFSIRKLPWPSTIVLDRSINSFLIRGRKSGQLSLAPLHQWLTKLVPPVTNVLLSVPFPVLRQRKQEMSSDSHQEYQQRLWTLATTQQSFDVIVLNNSETADEAAAVLLSVAQETTRQSSFIRPNSICSDGPPKVAA